MSRDKTGPITTLCVDTIRSRGLRRVVAATVTGRRGDKDTHSLFWEEPLCGGTQSIPSADLARERASLESRAPRTACAASRH